MHVASFGAAFGIPSTDFVSAQTAAGECGDPPRAFDAPTGAVTVT